MVAEFEGPVEAVAEAAEAVVEAPEAVVETAKPASKTVSKPRRRKARAARPAKASRPVKAAKVAKPKARAKAKTRTIKMTKDTTKLFNTFGAFPAANAFEKIFADASARGEEAVKKSRKAAEDFADLYRGNLDAFVEAGKIAANGAQSIGQNFVAKGRDSVEQTASAVRAIAEAKSPTELLQLQSDYARSAFDRLVEDSSNLTESLVKLAGEAFQPLSNRASANVERFNEITA